MYSPDRLKASLLLFFVMLMSACVTLPGHRFIIDEPDYFLHIESPSKQQRSLIRYNEQQTAVTHIPDHVWIEFRVKDDKGNHHLRIESEAEGIVYHYRLNGKNVAFKDEQMHWFATYIPDIIRRSGAKQGQL